MSRPFFLPGSTGFDPRSIDLNGENRVHSRDVTSAAGSPQTVAPCGGLSQLRALGSVLAWWLILAAGAVIVPPLFLFVAYSLAMVTRGLPL